MNVDKIRLHHYIRDTSPFIPSLILPKNSIRVTFDKPFKDSGFKEYRKAVWKLTESCCHLLDGIDLRGFYRHHIDHKVSIWDGYRKNIDPEIIGGINNLRMIPYKENLLKGRNSCASF